MNLQIHSITREAFEGIPAQQISLFLFFSLSLFLSRSKTKNVHTHTLSFSLTHTPFHSLFPPKLTAPYSHACTSVHSRRLDTRETAVSVYILRQGGVNIPRRESRNAYVWKEKQKKENRHPFDGPPRK